jgi:hypothetical protein
MVSGVELSRRGARDVLDLLAREHCCPSLLFAVLQSPYCMETVQNLRSSHISCKCGSVQA